MNKGRLFIISGPSGSGKDTVLFEVFKQNTKIEFSISSTTRPMRTDEKEGQKYRFISEEEFEEQLKNDMFLEHNYFVGNYYGTPKAPVLNCLEKGNDMVVEIDVNGAAQIRKKMPDAVSIFIMPPSLEVLKARLSKRGTDSPETIEKRMVEAVNEIKRADEYDYIVINDDLAPAVEQVLTLIKMDACSADRNTDIINQILNAQ